jgi:hypothetical protein
MSDHREQTQLPRRSVNELRIIELEKKLEESEQAMHLRIRAEYDSTIADCWREKIEELKKIGDAVATAVLTPASQGGNRSTREQAAAYWQQYWKEKKDEYL